MTEIDRYGMGAVMDQALFHLDPYRNRSKPCNMQHAAWTGSILAAGQSVGALECSATVGVTSQSIGQRPQTAEY